MVEAEWLAIVAALRNVAEDVDAAVAAAASLQRNATAEDVPGLLELLKEESFFVREAAAWPLSDLGRVDLLPQLLVAYQRGLDEGHDNDGFSAALIDLVGMNREGARPSLEALARSSDPNFVSHATWLLEFL